MKKIIISLVLAFSLFFSFGNFQVNAEITEKQEKIISNFLDNYFEKNKKKYRKEKAINILKGINKKVLKLKNNSIGQKEEILNYIYNSINNLILLKSNNSISCSIKKVNVDEKKYGKINELFISDDGNEKVIMTSKGKWQTCRCEGGEEFIGNYYYFYYKNDILVKSGVSKNIFQMGFINGKTNYIISNNDNKLILEVGDKKYEGYDNITIAGNNFYLRKKYKEKVLFPDGSLSKDYTKIFRAKQLINGKKIILAGKGKITWGAGYFEDTHQEDTFNGKIFIVENGVETELKKVVYKEWEPLGNIVTCNGKYGYKYSGKNNSAFLYFDGKTYGEEGFHYLELYSFVEKTCEPLFKLISDKKSKIFLGNKLITEKNNSISDVKIYGNDIFYKYYEQGEYKLYKNNKKIDDRGALQKYGFLENGELLYSIRYNSFSDPENGVIRYNRDIIIKKGNDEKIINGYRWTDNLYISKNKKHYVFHLRANLKEKLFIDGKIIENKNKFVDGMFIKNDFISVYTNYDESENYIYKNNKLIKKINGNANIIIPNIKNADKMDFRLYIDKKTNILTCK